MRPLLAAKFGDNVVQRIEDRLRAVSQLGTYHMHADFDRWVLRGTQNVSRALTSINPRSWLRQIGGVATLAADMPARAFRDGLTALRNPREFSRAYTEMIEGSGFFWNRFAESPSAMMSGLGSASGPVVGGGVGRESVLAAGRALRRGRPLEAARSLARVFDAVRIATWFDSMASRVAYLGWKAEAARVHPDWPEASRRSWALSQAEASVRRTQNTFSVTDSSAMSQKARLSPAWAPFVSFTGDSNKSLNMLVQAAATGDRKRLAAAAAVRALNAAWGGVVTAGVPLAGYLLVSAATGNTAGRERAKDKAWSDMGMAALRDLAGTVLFGDKLLDLAIGARKSYSGGPFETAAGGTFADLAQGLGDIATGVRTAVEARAEEDPEKMDEAIGRFMRAAEKAALGGLTLSGVPVAPVYRLGRNASRAATATHSEDLMAEWKTLDAIPEERRTEAQADRLSDLQLFRRRRQRAIQKARKAREDGDHAGAREWEQEVEAIALEFIGPDRAERRAGLQR
jgi:hypothetical protein